MKRIVFLFVLLSLACLPARAQSRVENGTVESRILGAAKEYRVYLPDGYDASPDRTYPVLYLLHGAGGSCDTWPDNYNMKTITDWRINSGFCVPMIIVMPDASGMGPNHRGPHMGYFNYDDWRYEDFFFEEFIPTIEKRYRIRSERSSRAIAGLSMGGFGMLCNGIVYSEIFSHVDGLSSALPIFEDTSEEDNNGLFDSKKAAFATNMNPWVSAP